MSAPKKPLRLAMMPDIQMGLFKVNSYRVYLFLTTGCYTQGTSFREDLEAWLTVHLLHKEALHYGVTSLDLERAAIEHQMETGIAVNPGSIQTLTRAVAKVKAAYFLAMKNKMSKKTVQKHVPGPGALS